MQKVPPLPLMLYYWIIDYYYLLLGNICMFRYLRPPSRYKTGSKVPIILLPGISNRWGFLKYLADFLNSNGHPVYVVPELGFNLLSIKKSAEIVDDVVKKNNVINAVIVALSKGGIIGKYFLVHGNSKKRMIGMIAVGSPFSGSKLAAAVPHPAFSELLSTSDTIRNLQTHTAVNRQIISLMPEFDNHVWAKNGSQLKGAANIVAPIKGHHKIIFDKKIWMKILEFVETSTAFAADK